MVCQSPELRDHMRWKYLEDESLLDEFFAAIEGQDWDALTLLYTENPEKISLFYAQYTGESLEQ